MGTTANLLQAEHAFQALAFEEGRLRPLYLGIDAAASQATWGTGKVDDLITNSARFLELFLVAVCVFEAMEEGRSLQSRVSLRELLQRAAERSGLNPKDVAREARLHLPGVAEYRGEPMRPTTSGIVRASRSLLEACPIDGLEREAASRGLEEWGHRCRVAYEGIQAYVLRSDPREQNRVHIVGKEFARGRLSLDEAATLMSQHRIDALATLQALGYRRPLQRLTLTPEERQQRLAEMRRDRLARAGAFSFTHDDVARDVIASERLEGVDARRWIAHH